MSQPARSASVDARFLESLKRAFAEHAGGGERITVADLQRALGLRSEQLARRVLRAFDTDGDGSISRDELTEGARALVLGSAREKLAFAFRLHDEDGDGAIDRDELRRMVCLGLAEDDVRVTRADVDRVAGALLSEADTNGDQRISLDELEAVLRRRPKVLEQITRSEARWIAPNEDLLARLDATKESGLLARLASTLGQRRLPAIVLSLWVLANVAIFAVSMIPRAKGHGHAAPSFDLFRQLSRACTSCITFDAAFVFVPVLRRFLSFLRATKLHHVLPVDEAIGFHRIVGNTLFGLCIAHGAAQLVGDTEGATTLMAELAKTRVLTGLSLIAIFSVMWWFARAAIRKSGKFELFYVTHLLYAPWVGLALWHASGVVAAMSLPLLGFLIELVLRRKTRTRRTEILSATALRSGVTRLQIARPPGFAHRAGDYLFLRIPSLARHEWHPFTISSAPERDTLTLHVRSLGNWTNALRALAEQQDRASSSSPLEAYVDGPYGSPSAHVLAAKHPVLIGAGIGVTPFASILESIVLRAKGHASESPSRVHFFWLNRDQYSFEWFAALLTSLEQEDVAARLDIHIHMTGGQGGMSAAALEVARDLLHEQGHADLLTGLRTKTHKGRPDWRSELASIKAEHPPGSVDVFFCGPPGLGRQLRPICAELDLPFREETF